jgi:hypothetical protein
MRKIEIIEIENSFLNFFTPAVLIPISYWLLNLIGWPSLYLRHLIVQSGTEIDLNLVHSVISLLFMIITCSLLYYLLIHLPRLKVHDAEFRKGSKSGFYTVGVFFCLIVLIQQVIAKLYNFGFGDLELPLQSLFPLRLLNDDLFYFLVFLIYDIVLYSLFSEIVFRRTLIPTLEDRGLSPLHAVILAALGDGFIDLPAYFIIPNYPLDVYNFVIGISIGICAGLIYISTRNIIFPIIFSISFSIFRSMGFFPHLINSLMLRWITYLLILLAVCFVIFFLYQTFIAKRIPKLIKIAKIPSSPNIWKGVIGYLSISLSLLLIQTIVVKVGRVLFNTEIEGPFPGYFVYILIFYAIAFTIPFFLTISTQWAKDPTN